MQRVSDGKKIHVRSVETSQVQQKFNKVKLNKNMKVEVAFTMMNDYIYSLATNHLFVFNRLQQMVTILQPSCASCVISKSSKWKKLKLKSLSGTKTVLAVLNAKRNWRESLPKQFHCCSRRPKFLLTFQQGWHLQ